MNPMSGIPDEAAMAYQNHATPLGLYKLETGWHTPPTMDGSMNPGLGVLGFDDPNRRNPNVGLEMYGVGTSSWASSAEIPGAMFADISMAAQLQNNHGRSASIDAGMQMPMVHPWMDPISAATPTTHHEMMNYDTPTSLPTPASMGSNYFPSPSVTPNVPHRHRPASVGATAPAGGASCTCFTVCLQSLQSLHNASSPNHPPFDVVLSLNRKAVEGCATMLACPRCMNRSGTHTATMLLATLIGKITTFYRNSSQTYFDHPTSTAAASAAAVGLSDCLPGNKGGSSPSSGLEVSLGGYTLGGEDGRWLELEILNRELRKLEDVYSQFRDVCTELSDDPDMGKAMVEYLGHTLGTTLEVVKHRQGRMQFA